MGRVVHYRGGDGTCGALQEGGGNSLQSKPALSNSAIPTSTIIVYLALSLVYNCRFYCTIMVDTAVSVRYIDGQQT